MILKGFREFINESESSVTYQDLKLLLKLGISQDITDDVDKLIDQGLMSHDEILDWVTPICRKYKIENWLISGDGRVDVNGIVNLNGQVLTRLPLRFGIVTDSFWCIDNQLTSLDGSPREVGGSFGCSDNQLTTLEGAPKVVGGSFYCRDNKLTSLNGAPNKVGGNFGCSKNQLTTLDGIGEVGGKVYSDLK